MFITDEQKCRLHENGYVSLPNFFGKPLQDELRDRLRQLFYEEGDLAGAEFKQEQGSSRLANLVNKGKVFQQVIGDAAILELVRYVLGPEIKLSSLNARSADPNNSIRQPLHADMSAVADDCGYWVCNTVWMLDDFTVENGPLRVIPGSHRFGKLPQDVLDDPTATHADEILITGEAGTVVVLNAHTWHGGMENRTDRLRLALHAFYCRRDKPQQQYQKQLLDASVQHNLSAELRELLALDDPLNDRLCAQATTRSGFLK
jgi:ectoine hydroxylase-related dioxygenase (phytanoyl-CoA dioxygenase family)